MTEPLRDRDDAMGTLLRNAKQGGELPRIGAQERVWKQLNTPKRATPAAWWLIPAALAATAALAAFVLTRASAVDLEPFATVTLASGDVQASNGSTWTTAKVGQSLLEGAQLRVASKSRAYTRLKGAGALFREGTRAGLSKQQVSLEDGTIIAAAKSKLRARAKEYSVDVETAVFQLEAAAEVVTLHVSDGEARVTGPNTDVVVRAGESWSSARGKGRAEMSPAEIATARALAASASDEVVLRIAKPLGAHISVDGVELGTSPLEVVVKRGDHQLAGVRGSLRTVLKANIGGPSTVELPEPKELPLPEVSFEPEGALPAPDEGPSESAPRLDPPADPAKRYMLARALAQKGRYPQALAIYEGLARGDSGWAEPSQYELGRLNLRTKRFGAAVKALDEYRSRWPKGSLAHEVALSSIEVQLKLGAGAGALKEMDDFLARFPSSERKGDVRFIRATVRRDRGDCSAAAADYLELRNDAVHADDALYFAAVCEQQIGEEAAARRHLTEYLERFPAGTHSAQVRRFFEGGSPSGDSPPP